MSAAAQAALVLRYTLDGNPAGKVCMEGGAVVLCVSVPHADLLSTCYPLLYEAAHCKLACWAQERMLGIPLQLPTPMQAGPPLLLPLCVSCLQAALQAGEMPA